MAKDVEHFFMYLLSICTSENCLFNSFALDRAPCLVSLGTDHTFSLKERKEEMQERGKIKNHYI
jgi:hypothetical protein